ncbi:hypothetical protein BJF79_30190 [Actinomadura sp. CNU-125]|nr:hypothetical protein BJF79_30190 [Actinomadura sp. CNU-125]
MTAPDDAAGRPMVAETGRSAADRTVADVREAGDHLIVIGTVREPAARDGGGPPLSRRGARHPGHDAVADA